MDKLEEIESKIRDQYEGGGFKRQWKSIDEDFSGSESFFFLNVFPEYFKNVFPENLGPPPSQSNFHFILLVLIGVAFLGFYYKYKQNRSKFWKTFYYLNDYKL